MLRVTAPSAAQLPRLRFDRWPTRHLFFTGKGGVGKTTTASAVAVALARAGQRTLLVSTDPASNLDDVFGIRATAQPTAVPDAPGLWIANIDPEAAAADYRERALAPYRGVLPDSALASIEEQLSGACTTEIAAFNQFTAMLTGDHLADYDRVLFDTAPTGHTLRLLTLPGAWSGYAQQHPAGASCLGPLAGLDQQRQRYQAAVDALADPELTELVLVARADPGSLREAARASHELRQLGVANQRLVVNGVMIDDPTDPIVEAVINQQDAALREAPAELAHLPIAAVELRGGDLTGLGAIQSLITGDQQADLDDPSQPPIRLPSLMSLVDELDQAGRGVVMTMGKGGVGKTTVAAALALALADRGHDVILSTTDPAAHLSDALAEQTHDRLQVQRIDPAAETARYTAEVLDAADGLDDDGLALLAEDLRSPCTEEIAVFRAFAATIDAGSNQIVVLDTAPTGHTLLLLDAAESYQREIERTNAQVPDSVRQLAQRLRDLELARILIVTHPEATPVHEAQRLQDDLRRAEIEPYGWVVNCTMQNLETDNQTLRSRAHAQHRHLARIHQLSATRTWSISWRPEPPVGISALRSLSGAVPAAT
jgi:arsenite-transporting ATPase